jgi:hypothetical protein
VDVSQSVRGLTAELTLLKESELLAHLPSAAFPPLCDLRIAQRLPVGTNLTSNIFGHSLPVIRKVS